MVTGASGFVGRHLVPALRRAYPDASLFDDPFDITDRAACAAAMRAGRPDACVHLAGIAAVPEARRDPDAAWRINLHGTLRLAEALLAAAPDCLLLHVSSADAYGLSFRDHSPLDETAPLAPTNTYAATKAAADLAIGALVSSGLRAIRLRPFNHTGPGQSEAFVVAAFAAQVARIAAGSQEPVLRVGRLDPERDFLDVRDVCAAYIACIARAGSLPAGTVLNLASGTCRRVGTVLDALVALGGIAPRIESDAARVRPTETPIACGDPTRAREALGWAPAVPWERTLADVLAYWRVEVARAS